MSIWKRLAIKNLKMNQKRTISTIIGIILSTALICGTATLIASMQKTLIQNAINETGYYHVKLQELNEEEIDTIEHNRDVKETFTVEMCGYAKLEKSANEDKPYAKVFSMKEETFQRLNFKMTEGRFPKNENEIIISQTINSNAKLGLQLGDTIELDIGKRKTLDGYDLKRIKSLYRGRKNHQSRKT